MDKSLFKKYIDEMKEMQKRSRLPITQPAVAEVGPEREEATELTPMTESAPQNTEDMNGEGFLLVNVTSTRELYPVRGAQITVFTGDADNMTILAEGSTDISGKAGPFRLAAPSIVYSEQSGSPVLPYAYYNILTRADGFVDTIHLGVQIFDRVTSIQGVNLLPRSETEENNTVIVNEFTERQGK